MKNLHKIKLIFGLGNPGKNFKNTPHNFGRDLVEYYFDKNYQEFNYSYLSRHKNLYLGIGKIYMNQSGMAIYELLQKLNLNPKNILIIHDEADLPFLKIKITFNRSSTHKGIESIYKICSNQIWRLRIGFQGKIRQKAEFLIFKKLTKENLKKWNNAKKKFQEIIEKLNNLPIEKLNIENDYFLKS